MFSVRYLFSILPYILQKEEREVGDETKHLFKATTTNMIPGTCFMDIPTH